MKLLILFVLLLHSFVSNASGSDSCTVYLRVGSLRKSAQIFDYDKFLTTCEAYTTIKLRLKAGNHSFSDNLRPGVKMPFVGGKDSVYFVDYHHSMFRFRQFELVSGRAILSSKKSGEFFRYRLPDENRHHIHTYNDLGALADSLHRLRNKTAALISEGDFDSLRPLMNVQLCNEWVNGGFDVYDLYSLRERIVFDFLLGNYSEILGRLKYNDDYFIQAGYDMDYLTWDDKSLLYDMVDVYHMHNEKILSRINKAKLSPEEKELLKTYWGGIQTYLKSEEELPETLRTAGADFIHSFPGSAYGSFVSRNFVTPRKIFVSNAAILRFDMGINVLGGSIPEYLSPEYDLQAAFGYEWKRNTVVTGYCESAFGFVKNAPAYDSVNIPMGKMKARGIMYEYARTIVKRSPIDLNLMLGIKIGNIKYPGYSDSLLRTSIRYYFGAGLNVVLLENLHPKHSSKHFTGYDEEVHKSFANLQLCIMATYSPNAYTWSLKTKGAVATFSIGLKYAIGSRSPVYRHLRE